MNRPFTRKDKKRYWIEERVWRLFDGQKVGPEGEEWDLRDFLEDQEDLPELVVRSLVARPYKLDLAGEIEDRLYKKLEDI